MSHWRGARVSTQVVHRGPGCCLNPRRTTVQGYLAYQKPSTVVEVPVARAVDKNPKPQTLTGTAAPGKSRRAGRGIGGGGAVAPHSSYTSVLGDVLLWEGDP